MGRLTLAEQLNTANEQMQKLRDEVMAAQRAALEYEQKYNVQLSVSEQLRGQLRDQPELAKKLEEVTKDRDQCKSAKDTYYQYQVKYENELEQAHAVLDSVTGAPSREYDGEYGKKSRNVVTRLAGAFLAIAQSGGVKA